MQHHFTGPGAIAVLEKVTPSCPTKLLSGRSTLSCFLHPETGGMVDDIVISRPEYASNSDTFHIVSNAGCREKVHSYITEQLNSLKDSCGHISWDVLPDQGLVALPGPFSAEILHDSFSSGTSALRFQSSIDLQSFYFGQNKVVTIAGLPNDQRSEILISRGGYTGEDGFELSIPSVHTATIAKHLLATAGPNRLRLAGLGARDSLRLEAGLCLYGQDLDDSITPVEAGLSWIVHRDRRESGGFHGDKVILKQMKQPRQDNDPSRRRVGMIVSMRAARAGATILAPADIITQPEVSAARSSEPIEKEQPATTPETLSSSSSSSSSKITYTQQPPPPPPPQKQKIIGTVTSGCPRPTLGQNIAMGYVEWKYGKPGKELRVLVGGKERKATVKKMPFIEPRLWKSPVPVSSPKVNSL